MHSIEIHECYVRCKRIPHTIEDHTVPGVWFKEQIVGKTHFSCARNVRRYTSLVNNIEIVVMRLKMF